MPAEILVVQAVSRHGRSIAAELTKLGWSVRRVLSAEEALEAMSAHRPALVLASLILPRTSGLALASRLKADPATRAIPIIAMTDLLFDNVAEVAREVGCIDCVLEAIDPTALSARITHHLAGDV